eukprot:478847_1
MNLTHWKNGTSDSWTNKISSKLYVTQSGCLQTLLVPLFFICFKIHISLETMAMDLKHFPLVIAPKDSEHMSCNELAIKIKKKDKTILVIDVRDPNIDYNGGHIPNSINIPYDKFDDSMSYIIQHILSINNLSSIIIHCMESKHRGPRCCNKFTDWQKQISQYNKLNTNKTSKHIIELIQQYDNLPSIISKIKVYLLTGGFQAYINKYHNKLALIQNFDKKYWKHNQHGILVHTLYDIKHNENLVKTDQ